MSENFDLYRHRMYVTHETARSRIGGPMDQGAAYKVRDPAHDTGLGRTLMGVLETQKTMMDALCQLSQEIDMLHQFQQEDLERKRRTLQGYVDTLIGSGETP